MTARKTCLTAFFKLWSNDPLNQAIIRPEEIQGPVSFEYLRRVDGIVRITEKHAIKEDCFRIIVRGMQHTQRLKCPIIQKY